jgi:hypothetical protein
MAKGGLDPKVLLLDVGMLGLDHEVDRTFDRRLFCLFPDWERVGLNATAFWPASDGTVLYKKPGERNPAVVCSYFVPAGAIPHYTTDLSAAVALMRRVLGAGVCYVLNSTDMVACTIWRAGPENRIYAGYQILERGPKAEAQVVIAAMLKCVVDGVMPPGPPPAAEDPFEEGHHGRGGPGTHDYASFA